MLLLSRLTNIRILQNTINFKRPKHWTAWDLTWDETHILRYRTCRIRRKTDTEKTNRKQCYQSKIKLNKEWDDCINTNCWRPFNSFPVWLFISRWHKEKTWSPTFLITKRSRPQRVPDMTPLLILQLILISKMLKPPLPTFRNLTFA